ncbi:MAG: FecR family protein [Bryobacterales bacterium]|nr:FecR family protein [Bryobacterales bacterium]
MNNREDYSERLLDETIDHVRGAEAPEAEMRAAADRVWASLERNAPAGRASAVPVHAVLSTESDFEALFAAYHAGTLPEARRELLEARIHEEVATRKAWLDFKARAEGRPTEFEAAAQRVRNQANARVQGRFAGNPLLVRWAAVAAMLVAVAGLSWYGWNAWGPEQSGPQATVHAANGPLYLVEGDSVAALATGAGILPRQQVRVPEGTRATLRLRDGSLVEVRPGSTFTLSSFGSDLTVNLLGGDVIVEAAKRSRGRLYVASKDLEVAVTGTVFAVGTGVKGSRVGVLEGSVLVAHRGNKQSLRPGQQYASSAGVTSQSLEDQVAWSENLDRHLALLRSLTALDAELAKMRLPSLRYQSELLAAVPANTTVYASVPNLEDTIRQAREIIGTRLQSDAALRDWMTSASGKFSAEMLLGELQGFSAFAGDEMLLVAIPSAQGEPEAIAFVAALAKPGFEDHLRQRFAALAGGAAPEALHFYHSLAELANAPTGDGVHVLLSNDRLVLSPSVAAVRAIGGSLMSAQPSGFTATAFGARVQQTYQRGAGFFLAADLNNLIRKSDGTVDRGAEFTGIDDLRFLEIEQRHVNQQADLRSTFTFGTDRHGVASWLAAPGALRALEFVSSQAAAVSAATVKDPVAMLEDVLALAANGENSAGKLGDLETKLGIRIREDLAQPLGSEVAFAIDGPVIPVPSWKLVVQVNDPVRLNTAIQRVVEAFNREMSLQGKPVAQFSAETVDGIAFHTIAYTPRADNAESGSPSRLTTLHYVFANGYLIAGPDRGLLRQAIQTQASGTSILTDAKFRELLPADAYTGFSGVFFQQAAGALGSLAAQLAAGQGGNPQQAEAMQQLAKELKPSLVHGLRGFAVRDRRVEERPLRAGRQFAAPHGDADGNDGECEIASPTRDNRLEPKEFGEQRPGESRKLN